MHERTFLESGAPGSIGKEPVDGLLVGRDRGRCRLVCIALDVIRKELLERLENKVEGLGIVPKID